MIASARGNRAFVGPFGLMGELRAEYDGARESRFRRQRRGVNGIGKSADYHYRSEGDYLRLMELARDLDRNEPVLGQMFDRAADNIVQKGFPLSPCSGNKEYDKAVKLEWLEWASDPDSCDAAGEDVFGVRQWLNMRQTLVDGDVFDLALSSGALAGAEAHRCRTPSQSRERNVVHGVKLGANRTRLQYWFTKDDISPLDQLKLVSDVSKLEARNEDGQRQIFHIYKKNRYSQTRGVTALAPIFDYMGIQGDLVFATLVRHLIANCVVFLREKGADFTEAGDVAPTGETSQQQLADGSTRLLQGIAPGTELEGRKGEKITGFSPGLGDPQLEPLLFYVLAVVGANIGLPLIMVLLDSSKTNFSGWRGAFDQAKIGFRARQQMLINRHATPVYRWKLQHFLDGSEALRKMADRMALSSPPGAHAWHEFQPPSWPYVDPLKDATADLLQEANGLNSARRLRGESGADIDDLQDEIITDRVAGILKAKKAAAEINEQYPDDPPVHWRELMPIPSSEGMTISVVASTADEAEPAAAKKPKKKPAGSK